MNGKPLGTIGIHLDITERKKLEEDLTRANEIANASSKAKELFLANMSHEIRTPLNAVIGVTQLMARSELNESQENYIQTISKSADNLLLLVNNILDLSKIEADGVELEFVPFNLISTLDSTVSSLNYLAKSKGLSLKLITNERLNSHYEGDALRLSQILINLTNNAIKFTEQGNVQIVVEASESEDGYHEIRFKIIDSGIGIRPEAIKTIFEGFMQARQDTSRKYGGTGLGLSICKDLVALFDSELKVKSEVAKGSTFYFTLKLKLANEIIEEHQEVEERLIDWENVTILVAEDNEVNQFVAISLIENWGAKTLLATNGIEAIEKIEQHPEIDIVLMDMQMPEMDGVSATKEIRSKLKSDVPIIALTANAIKGDKEKCKEAGMDGYMSKPFKDEVLRHEISKALDDSYLLKEGLPTQKELILVPDRIEEMAAGNEVFKIKMLRLFLKEGYAHLVILERETEVVKLSETAHKMKPSIDYLATRETRDLVRKIENQEFISNPSILQTYTKNFSQLLSEIEAELNS